MYRSKSYFTKGAGIFAVIAGILVILDYYFHIPELHSALYFDQIKFNSALCIVLMGVALFLLDVVYITRRRKLIVQALAIIVLLISGISLCEYIFSWNAGIDELFHKANDSVFTEYPGRMKIGSCIMLMVLSAIILMLYQRSLSLLLQILLVTCLAAIGLSFLAFAVLNPYSGELIILGVLLHASFIFTLLFLGLLFSRPLSYIQFSFEKKIAGYFSLVIILMTMVFLIVRNINTRSERASEMIEVSREILLQTQRVTGLSRSLEMSTRGFIISGNNVFLDAINGYIPQIHQSVEKLKQLCDTVPDQKLRIESLGKIIEKNIERSNLLVSLKKTQQSDAVNKLFEEAIVQKRTMAALNDMVDSISREENRLLDGRKADHRKSVHDLSIIINLFYSILLLLLLISFIVIYRNTRARNKAEEEIKNLNITLEKGVEEKARELVEKETQYRFLIENMREGVQVIGFDWRYLLVNKTVMRHSKYTNEEELLGYTMMNKYPGIEKTELFQALEECMQQRIPKTLENEFIYPDGTHGWYELSIQPVPEGIFILSVDITDRKKMQEEKNSLLETLQKSVNEIYTFSPQTLEFQYVNNAALKNLGYTEDELYSLTALDIKTDQTPQSFNELVKPLINNEKEKIVYQTNHNRKDGSQYPAESTIQLIRQKDQDVFLAAVLDITERVKAERSIFESEERRRLIMNAAIEAIICTDLTGAITFWNPHAERIFGWKFGEVKDKKLSDIIFPPRYRALHQRELETYLETGHGKMFNKLVERKAFNQQGNEFPVELTILPIKQGDREFFCAFVRDISERKRSEAITRQLNLDLEKRANELLASNAELERFAFVASHDLQEPLRMISSFLQLLKKRIGQQLDDTNKQYLHFAVDGAERMKKLIQDLLEYSRTANGRETITEVDCNKVLVNVTKLYRLVIDELEAKIVICKLPVVKSVETEMQQLFQNLIGNALKYHNAKPLEIEVGCIEEKNSWKFYVKDNGLGIDAKYFDKIFIIFQRLHNKSEYSGTGIGLSVCKKIVNSYGGQIWVDSEVGEGSTFYFIIPK